MNLVLKTNAGYLFLGVIFLFVISNYLFNFSLLNEQTYYQSYSDQLSVDQISNLFNKQLEYRYVTYIFLVLMYLFKFSTISTVIYTGFFFYNIKVSFSQIFKIVLLSELIFIIPIVFKFVWFAYVHHNYTLTDIQSFYPLSLKNLVSTNLLWTYPLQTLNIFEVGYWFLLAYLLADTLDINFDKSLKVILSSYLPMLATWLIFVMFLLVNVQPA